MKNDRIYSDIRRISSVTKTAKALGCTKQSLRNKLSGITPWKITEIVTMARYFRWTIDEFLDIIEYDDKEGQYGRREEGDEDAEVGSVD